MRKHISDDRIATAISSVRIVRRRIRAYHESGNADYGTEAALVAWEHQLARVCAMLGDDRPLGPVAAVREDDLDGEPPF